MSGFLLEGVDLTKEFPAGRDKIVHAVTNVSLGLKEGETLGLVGESGCGKSTLGRIMIRALKPTSGEVLYRGRSMTAMSDKEFDRMRRCFQMIFQDPYASLNPRMTVRDLIAEPVSALDVSVQNQILNLLSDLKKKRGLTYLFISHDLSVVRHISERVCVMFLGKICESGPTAEVWSSPAHPYTSFLLKAVPKPDPGEKTDASSLLTGEIPSPISPPPGCRFHTRCPFAGKLCSEEEPPVRSLGDRTVACHFPLNMEKT